MRPIAALLAAALFTSLATPGAAQAPAPARQDAAPLDNYTIQHLILLDDQGRVLLEKNAVGWMTPALRSSKRESIRQSLEGLARDLGVTTTPPKLAGVFTYRFQETPPDPHHAAISFRTHYLARLTGGAVVQPADPTRSYAWVASKEVGGLIAMDSLRVETQQILDHPDTLWGGAFEITFADGKLAGSRTIEEPYPLRE